MLPSNHESLSRLAETLRTRRASHAAYLAEVEAHDECRSGGYLAYAQDALRRTEAELRHVEALLASTNLFGSASSRLGVHEKIEAPNASCLSPTSLSRALIKSGSPKVVAVSLFSGILLVASAAQTVASPPEARPVVELAIEHGRFVPAHLHLPKNAVIHLRNRDAAIYTFEGPGILPGDVYVAPHADQTVEPLREAGKFWAMLEEAPAATLDIESDGSPPDPNAPRVPPFDAAKLRDRQPLLPVPGFEPAYASYTAFDFAVKGEAERQRLLRDLYTVALELSEETPPAELAPYFAAGKWGTLRPSVAMVIGLGPGAYAAKRFGPNVAAARPAGLHPFPYAARLGVKDFGQRDVLVRVVSDSAWFNGRVCRLVWRRLQGRIANSTLIGGFANPNGRSPILGGFFDGMGNPSGPEREAAVYDKGENGTYLGWFKIRFDEERFAALPLAARQAAVGRERDSGKPLAHPPSDAHRVRAQNDNRSFLYRMPTVYDHGPDDSGLLFVSAQASLRGQLERILGGFMLGPPKAKPDRLLSYMHFQEAAYYYVPPSPRGSYPGSLRR